MVIMDSVDPRTADDSKLAVKTFLKHLGDEQRDEFEAILDFISEELPDASPLQRATMAMAYMIQEHVLGKGFAAVLDGDDLSRTERDLLEWARKNYDSNVNRVYEKRNRRSQRTSVPEILEKFRKEREDWDDDGPVFEQEFSKIELSPDEVDFSGQESGAGGENRPDSGSEDDFEQFWEDDDDDSDDDGPVAIF